MAIVVESQQKRGSIGKLLIWLLLLGVVVFGMYYLFFKRPDVIPSLTAPAAFKQATELSGVKLDPGTVVQSAPFQSLKQQAPQMQQPATGRTNPFAPI
jgi:hypothetical protein